MITDSDRLGRWLGVSLASATLLLGACTGTGGLLGTVGPSFSLPSLKTASAWLVRAPSPALASQGAAPQPSVTNLYDWWKSFDDPLLLQLIEAAQRSSPTVAQAQIRIINSRALLNEVRATGAPSLEALAGINRSAYTVKQQVLSRTQAFIGLQSSWEIDLFGGLTRQSEAATANLQADELAWHDARISVAADTAQLYLAYRTEQVRAGLLQTVADSAQRSADMVADAVRVGMMEPARRLEIERSLSEASGQLLQSKIACDQIRKALVALTGIQESVLTGSLVGQPPQASTVSAPVVTVPVLRKIFVIEPVPAQALLQRPDILAAQQSLAAASADIGIKDANRYPKLSLTGSIYPPRTKDEPANIIPVQIRSIGPSVSVPLFDGGRSASEAQAAKLRYRQSEILFEAKVRLAVREIEDALLGLEKTTLLKQELTRKQALYEGQSKRSDEQFKAGLLSAFEREQTRREALDAQLGMVQAEFDYLSAWVSLYRSAGGGWQSAQLAQTATNTQ